MASTIGVAGTSSSWVQSKIYRGREMRENNRARTCSVFASVGTVCDPYKTLRIQPTASKSEVKRAFRKLALQYHPDVCRGNTNGVQFHRINEAYDMVMSQLREGSKPKLETPYNVEFEKYTMGMDDLDCDLWEEWMGWEGAGIRDYSSHINPYI